MTPSRTRAPFVILAGLIVFAFAAFRSEPRPDGPGDISPSRLRSWTVEVPTDQGFAVDPNPRVPGHNGFVITDVLATGDAGAHSRIIVQIESPTTVHAVVPVAGNAQGPGGRGIAGPSHVELRHGIPVPAGEPLMVRVRAVGDGARAWVTLLGYAW